MVRGRARVGATGSGVSKVTNMKVGEQMPALYMRLVRALIFFFFQAEDGIRDLTVTGVQTCALPIFNLTTGGAPTMSIEERLEPALRLKPEVASLNMGSMNFGLYEMLGRYKEFKHDWEKPYLAGSDERIFKNSFKDIAYILQSCADNDTRFEIEFYDIGHLYTAAHFLERRLLKPPLVIQSVFGIRGGIGPHPEDVLHMKPPADPLFGDAS